MMKRTLSLFLAVALGFAMLPMPAAAAEHCQHHETHTDTCGYVEAVAGSDCAHSHDGSCGYAEAVAEVPCACETTDESGALVHTEGCGYAAPVTGAACTHTHDTAVCGYVQAVEGKPCTYRCDICLDHDHADEAADSDVIANSSASGTDPEEIATSAPDGDLLAMTEEVCTCETKCTGDAIHAGCEVCAADLAACEGEIAVDPAVAAVRELIAALPGAEALAAMSTEEQNRVYDALLGADEAYQALNEEQKGQLAEENAKLDALFAYFSSPKMTAPAAATPTVESYDVYANGTPLLIVEDNDIGGTVIYIDTDGDGVKDDDEKSLQEAGLVKETDLLHDGSTSYQYCNIYGGSKDGAVESTSITMTGGKVQFIYGGSGAGGSVNGNTEVVIKGGAVRASVYGGGFKSIVGGKASVTVSGGMVGAESNGHGVYGGGDEEGSVTGSTEVTITGGTPGHRGDDYGDVHGGGDDRGIVTGKAKVTITGGTMDYVYGGGDSGSVGSTEVLIDTGSTVTHDVYGGQYWGGSVGKASVTIKGTVEGNVYGGSGTYGGSVGSTEILIGTGGTVTGNVYGGSGQRGGSVGSAHVKCENGGANKITFDAGISRAAGDGNFQSVTAGETTPQGYFEYLSAKHYTASAIADPGNHAIICADGNCSLKLTGAAAPHSWNTDGSCETCGYTFYDVWVGGAPDAEAIDVTALVNDTSKVSGTVTYAPSTGTLTLNNASITGENLQDAIKSESALNLVLTGENKITGDYGILANGAKLTIGGSGSLTLTVENYGISAHSLMIEGVTVNINSNTAQYGAIVLKAGGTIKNSMVKAVGDSSEYKKAAICIESGTLEIDSSSVYVESGYVGIYGNASDVSVILNGDAHVKVDGKIIASGGVTSRNDGYLRGAPSGTFEHKDAGALKSDTYFEYVGEGHYEVKATGGEEHSIECLDGNCPLKLTDASAPHRWIATTDGADCADCPVNADASVTTSGTTDYYTFVGNAVPVAEEATGSILKLFDNVERITVKQGGFVLNPNGRSIEELKFESGSPSIGITSQPGNIPAVTMAAPGVFATPSGVTLEAEWFKSDMTGYVVVKDGDNLKLAKGITADMVEDIQSATYSGSAQAPIVTVKWDGTPLNEKTDYTVSYTDSKGNPVADPTNAGTYTVTVTGMGDYVGKVEKTYTIEPKSLTDATVTAQNQTYNGRIQTPEVTVTLADYTITAGDYDVRYSPDTLTNAGSYTITITGKGNFTGTKTGTFVIDPVDISNHTANSPDQITIFGRGDFTEPTIPGVAGETVPGTFQYSITAANGATVVTNGNYEAVKASLATLEGDKNVDVNWKFSPATGNYTGTKDGSFTVTAKDIEFKVGNDAASATNAIHVLISATEYGKTWNERISLKSGSITASVGNTTVGGSYTIVPDNGALTDRPGVGTHGYTVKFTGGSYTDVTVFTGTLTVTPKPVTVTADDVIVPLGTDMNTVRQTYTVSGLCGTDTLTVAPAFRLSAVPDTSKEGEYTITPSGADAGSNYTLVYRSGLLKVRGPRTITVAAAANGKVSVSHTSAIEGTPVTITVTPNSGCKFSTLVVTDASGKQVAVSADNNGKYGFTMPYSNVTVKATFASTSTGIADPTNPKTGDDFNLVLWSSMATASMLCLAALFFFQKKGKHQR